MAKKLIIDCNGKDDNETTRAKVEDQAAKEYLVALDFLRLKTNRNKAVKASIKNSILSEFDKVPKTFDQVLGLTMNYRKEANTQTDKHNTDDKQE